MFGRMMNNYYYGKSGKGDYKKNDLPKNRRQLFFEMLRTRFSALFKINLMTALAFVPLMYVLGSLISQTLSLMSLILTVEKGLEVITDEMRLLYDNRADALYSLIFRAFLYLIPAITITGPVQAGLAYITRNWARDEHSFLFSDFKDTVKQNWKQSLVVSFITGLVPIVMLVCWRFYGNLAKDQVFYTIPQVLTLSLGVIWFLALSFIYPMIVSYDSKLGSILKNSLLLAIGKLPQTIGIRFLALIPALVAILFAFFTSGGIYALFALIGYYLFFGTAFSRFLFASYTNAMFDKYINAHIEGADINRGLAKVQEEEEEDDEDDSDEA